MDVRPACLSPNQSIPRRFLSNWGTDLCFEEYSGPFPAVRADRDFRWRDRATGRQPGGQTLYFSGAGGPFGHRIARVNE